MKELMTVLKNLGIPPEEIRRISARYKDDPDGLRIYTLYLTAVLDDRYEYPKEDAYALE